MANVAMAGGGSAPGERRGGRKKGAANKRTADLVEQLEALGLDPVAELAEAMQAAKDQDDLASWIGAAKALLPYMFPKRRSVDVTSNAGPMQLVIATGIPADPPKEVPAASQALMDQLAKLIDEMPDDD